ncbi:4'-phosphopantetheinyl transferase superfamily protein [Paracoccus sp. 11-3]|uniref:Enterobactin synthase component D n=1 Tax=Paracoccus amoyensis TaxID=2760093 RepID=A0A926GE98_9RHOB|nr:4'-phosphopantetheinyl transferase superfamily protein [Paracoccus amoyensis]MBC9247575.1 4'-phosphopantetheinyl transferase superfamily protein [Paracoccus amoyensis]
MCRNDQIPDLLTAAAASLSPGVTLAVVPVTVVSDHQVPADIRDSSPKRRNRFAAGRRAAQQALLLAGYRGCASLEQDPDGLPQWPKGWLGSISHTDTLAAAAVMATDHALATVLGVDLERLMDAATALEIAHDAAPEHVSPRDAPGYATDITRIFSAKEALYKALFPTTRQFREFDAARAVWRGEANATLQLVLTEEWGNGWSAGTCFDVQQTIIADHILTVIRR